MEYNYKAIGQRILKLRNSKGWSQTELINRLRDHGGAVSRNKLSEIENGEYKDFKFSFVTAMCEIFNCDTGYLLCEYDERIRFDQDVHDMIGLSGKAITRLYAWYHDNKNITEVLNYLLEHEDMMYLLMRIDMYCSRAEEYDANHTRPRPIKEAFNESEFLSAARFNAAQLFGNMLNDIYDDTNNNKKKDYKTILAKVRATS